MHILEMVQKYELEIIHKFGINSIMDNDVIIGDDVTMGPDMIIYTSSHEYKELGIPINQQGEKPHRPVIIGNNVWIGARCIILPESFHWR